MPNIATVLKAEISRIARREARAETEGLKKAVATYRNEIASLKRRAKSLEEGARVFNRATVKANALAAETSVSTPIATGGAFSAKALAAQRHRLQLSADRLALLVGVSGQSIYNWERGLAAPHAKHVGAILALKTLSVQQAQELVDARRK